MEEVEKGSNEGFLRGEVAVFRKFPEWVVMIEVAQPEHVVIGGGFGNRERC